MLELLRKAAKTWIAKFLFVVLILSFGIWGASQKVTQGTSSTVMRVGQQEISLNEFALAYKRQVAALSQQIGQPLTTEQAKMFGVEQQVYEQLLAGATLDELSRKMNLGLSEKRLAQLIAEDPAFKSVNGAFDRQLFTTRLRNAGLREDDYIRERSKVAIRSQLVDAVADGFTPPKALTDAMIAYRDESRSADYLLLTNANIDPVKEPPEDTLAAWFEKNKANYRAPEYRKIAYVTLQAADIADPATVLEDAVKADYEKHKDQYRTPESRVIEQVSFTDKDMAKAAAQQIAAGTTFDQLIKDQGKTEADVTLGSFTRDKVPDLKIGEAAFAIKTEGGVSGVVEGDFGPVILRVTKIVPETVKSYDAVKDQIRKDLAVAAAAQDLLSVHDRYEDLRASGSSLTDAAKQLKLKPVLVAAIDGQGQDKDGNRIKDLPDAKDFLATVFKAEVGAEANALALGNDGYLWFEVQEIMPERDRTLAEVHDKVVDDWTAEEQKKALAAKAKDIAEQVRKGKPMADIANALGITVETKTGINRGMQDAILGRGVVGAAFGGPVGLVASDLSSDGTAQVVLKVTASDQTPSNDVLNPAADVTALAKVAGDDILSQMVTALRTEYGADINRTLAQQAMAR